jgi:hypothetical protein
VFVVVVMAATSAGVPSRAPRVRGRPAGALVLAENALRASS